MAHIRTTHPGAKGVCVPPLRWLGTKAWAGSHVAPAPSTQPRPASWGSAELVLGELSRGPGHGAWESPLAMRVGWLPHPGPPSPAHLPLRAAAPKSCPCPGAALVFLDGREEWAPFLCQPEPPRCPPHGPEGTARPPPAPTQQAQPQPRMKPCGATLRLPGLWGPEQGSGQSQEPGGCSGPRLGPDPRPGRQGWLWSPCPWGGGRPRPALLSTSPGGPEAAGRKSRNEGGTRRLPPPPAPPHPATGSKPLPLGTCPQPGGRAVGTCPATRPRPAGPWPQSVLCCSGQNVPLAGHNPPIIGWPWALGRGAGLPSRV